MNKTVSERIVLTRIINYLETVILRIVFNVNVCAQGSPQYFDALDGEHIGSKIMGNALKAWVILQEKLRPLVYVPNCGALSQEHCFAQVKIKIAIEFENWLRCCGVCLFATGLKKARAEDKKCHAKVETMK